ncbi:50S ribosomal protein L11 methyltransferase [Hydrogenimonas cancrithermarum]|uniref:Ribosomal protein L11 methyltransferase n=1 Tax=Hydrogenimonas cancrithermarum TaxID=2993563 RepID=A0ABN6WYX9_9BACT|nr:50S ribosomal protein L11 methyltransferase [Hydrogenimonas cancrithermarum]BDY13472.1 ribosomal protein L11 methyltransferase [Hydrogenimonas cancrithermarum]
MKDTYSELTVRPSNHLELFLDFLQTLFPETIEITEDALILRSEEPLEEIAWGAKAFAEALSENLGEPVHVDTSIETKENVDWIARYREAIKPVEVGDFYVYPSWEAPKEGKRNIMIDPALAFGSGHHETTSSCLKAIGERVKENDTLLDVGCGSGILGIAAAMLGAKVDACDTDPLAVENAQKNFGLNNQCVNEIWEGSAPGTDKSYDVVVANIVADVLRMIAKDLKKRTKPGGLLILSGILDTKEALIDEAFSDLELQETIANNEWLTKIYRKEG